MKAVIMAGGKGTRLRPLTDSIPKPLLPIAGIPCINRILRLLRRHNITEAAVTTGYLADSIEKALGHQAEGVSLTYFREESPLGTAGSVAQARDFIGNDAFVVISGDALSETDLTAAWETRQRTDALALLVLTRVTDPGEYGVVLMEEDGRITGFSEKPSLSATFSNTVNTGIYLFSPEIFSHIPNGVCDFGRDLFPILLQQGRALYGTIDESYWCDIGDYESYRLANLRFTNGANAIGPHSHLPETGVAASVIGSHCQIGQRVRVENAILGDRVTVEDEVVIAAGSVIGADCMIGEGAVLSEGTVLAAGTRVPAGAWLRSGASGGSKDRVRAILDGNGIRCSLEQMTTALAVRIGGALCEACERGRIGLLSDGTTEAGRIGAALLRGLRAAGGEVFLLGHGFEAAASYAASAIGLNLSLFLRAEDGQLSVSFYDRFGLYPKRDFERKFLALLDRDGDPFSETPRPTSECDILEEHFLPMLTHKRCSLDGFPITILRENAASFLLTRALLTMGARITAGGLRLSVSDDGFLLSAEQDGFTADDWHIKALLLRYLIRDSVALPVTAPEAVLDLCRERCLRYTHCPSGNSEDTARAAAMRHPELLYGAAAAMELAGLLAVSGRTLKELCRHLPHFAWRTAELENHKSGHLGILPTIGTPAGDGVVATYAHGSVRVIPSRKGFRLMAEAASGEYAEELLSLSEKEIQRRLQP